METPVSKEKRIDTIPNANSKYYSDPIWILTKVVMILATQPFGLGGLILKARHGPTRDKILETIEDNLSEFQIQKVHPGISELHLDGGLDFASTLEQGKAVYSKGLFNGTPKFVK
ncbi:MAG: hypothetical protein VYA61_07980, partial [Pseudomonadota bacterium]|nr:hypothetical protein [Pseudomonadota bacterium]